MPRRFEIVFAALLVLPLVAFKAPAAAAQDQPHGGHEPQGSHAHGHHHDMQHDFSDVGRWVRAFEGDDRDAWQQPGEVVHLMAVTPGMTVVDLGAGTGYFLPHLAKAVGERGKVLALDPEPALVDYMKERIAREGLTVAEARQIPYDDPQLAGTGADRILIVNTWHHIENRPAYSALLREGLAPGGEVWIVDFTRESPEGPGVQHRLEPAQVIEELRAGGLEAFQKDEVLSWQYIVVGRRPAR